MSVEHNAKSIIVACIADGAIAAGHAVNLVTTTGDEKHVAQSSAANTAWGVYVGDTAAAQYDHVDVCIFGPCKAWVDGVLTVNPPLWVSNDADGHIVAEAADKKRALGETMCVNGATENMGEVFVRPFTTSQ